MNAAAAEIRPTDLVIVAALLQRRRRVSNFQAELASLGKLSQVVADAPREALRRFPDVARRFCNAGSAGLSLLRPNAAGDTIAHWEAISGALASHEGMDTPRDFSPCGLCLDASTTIVVSRPERAFAYLHLVRPSIVESLIVPLYDNVGNPLGTFWVAHHDVTSRFCCDDVRIMEQLASQLLPALKLLELAKKHRYALALLESHQRAQRSLFAHNLAEERSLRERAEASESAMRQTLSLKDAVIQEVHHRAKNTLQIASNLLSLHARQSSSPQVRAALHESHGRLHLLAKIHELLYASADSVQEIPMTELLQSISDALLQSFAEVSSRVRFEIACEPIMLCADEAIPVALLANEALTNAYKHAFPDGCAGTISLNLSCAPENWVILRVMDSGIGTPSKGDRNGLGLTLLRGLAAQLNGMVAFSKPTGTEGTVVTLRFQRAAKLSPAETFIGESADSTAAIKAQSATQASSRR